MGVVRKTFRNGVHAEPAGKRMAAGQAPGAEPDTAEDAEPFDSLVSVQRACGLEAAGAGEENGEIGFVAAEGEKSQAGAKRRSPERCRDVRCSKSAGGHKGLRSLSRSLGRTGKGA